MTSELKIGGMTCQNCARHVREALETVKGVEYAEVVLEEARARVKGGEMKDLVEAVGRVGYTAEEGKSEAQGHRFEKKRMGDFITWKVNVISALGVAVVLMGMEYLAKPGMGGWFGWLSFAAVLPVQVLCGWKFYEGAWRQALVGKANMDMLVALGSTTAFGLSFYGLLAPGRVHHLYFSEAAMILGLISLGHYLESRVGEQAAGALKQLMQLAPSTALRIGKDDVEETVELTKVGHGDRVVLSPGDQAPADGEVVEGHSTMDESMLTGESAPVEKGVGAKVYAGTMNESGRLVVAVTGLGEETALARIIEVVRRAQASRASIQRIGDTVSSIFVPVVVGIAVATAVIYGMRGMWENGWIDAAGVLIVACPCAMGLATPAAIMAGTNAAARRGILVRDGSALEKCGRITAVLFDKTGTLTEGRPRVERFETLNGSADATRGLAKGLAQGSKHPYSGAVVAFLEKSASLPVSGWREERGLGVSGEWEGRTVFMGSVNALRERGVKMEGLPEMEGTVLGLEEDGKLMAAVELDDPLKGHAAEIVERLRQSGLHICVVSGDGERVVRRLAGRAGIPREGVFAEVRPEAKGEIVKRLQDQGERVAFVGDGINDAPALAQADLGIAVMRASDVARAAADVLLLKADIEAIPEALEICRATLRTIKQNLFWAFFYNAAAIPLAAMGLLPPAACAAAMAVSDLCVIGNSLRLLRRGRRY